MTLEVGFVIGTCRVLPKEGRIEGQCGVFRVEPKAMDVLLELARHAPQVCARERIVRAVWPRGYVSDDVLTRCISQLRRALGDDARNSRLLETIPKRGYRLQRPAAPLAGSARAHDTQPAVLAKTLIVLPLRQVSAGGDAFIAEGVTDLLILQLGSLQGVRVISRTTAMRFAPGTAATREIAEVTGADWIVEGSVIQEADHVQMVVQLVDTHADLQRWGATFQRKLHDLLPLLNEMAGQLAKAIHARIGHPLHAHPPTLSSDLVRAYLLARQAISRRTAEGLRAAVRRFDAITAQAPGFASAWASRAECELLLAHYGAPDAVQLIGDCRIHIERALALETGLPLALSARSAARLFFDCDVDGAAQDAQRALAAMPHYVMAMLALANVAAVRGNFAAASAWIEQARLTDPLDVGIAMNLGDHMIFQDRYEDAARALTGALQLVPDHRPSRLRLAWALSLCGRAEEAWAAMDAAGTAGGADPAWLEHAALVAAAAGDIESAAAHAQALETLARAHPVTAWSLARASAAAGRAESALRWLAQASEQRCSWIVFVHLMPVFDGLGGAAQIGALARGAVGEDDGILA